MLEIFGDEALNTQSTCPFKGNIDLDKFAAVIEKYGAEKISFVRMEGTTNLIGGQPFSMENLREVREMAVEARHPGGGRRQPDLRKRLFHQAARGRLRRTNRSAKSSAR